VSDQHGTAARKAKFPFQLLFKPSNEVAKLFPDEFFTDYKVQLAKLVSGKVLYTIFAKESPHSEEVDIGTLKMASVFRTSKFGDESLFF